MIPATTSAYIHNNRLCMVGVVNTDNGIVPFAHSCKLDSHIADGPVNIGADNLPAPITKAINNSIPNIQSSIDKQKLQLIVENLVERARLCDQNAVGMLVEIRENAKKGVPRARDAFLACKNYIKQHPFTNKPFFAGDVAPALEMRSPVRLLAERLDSAGNGDQYAAIVAAFVPGVGDSVQSAENAGTVLANGPPLTKEIVKKIIAMIEKKNIFISGLKSNETRIKEMAVQLSPEGRKALQLGYAVGLAKRLQDVRLTDSPISKYSIDAGWELGE